MNIAKFQILLHEAIDNATSTIDWLFLARAIEKLDMGQIRTVSTYANLPSAASNEGLLVFVTADERLYWSNGSAWYSIIQENKGFAYAWGEADFGRLGSNNTIDRSSPVSVVGGFTDWCQVSAGGYHSLGVRTNGTAWAWGCGTQGRLGTNNTITRSSPVSVVGGFTDWCYVAAGTEHSLGIRNNGTAWGWGRGDSGQLGDNTAANRSSPVSVVGGFTDWCQLSTNCQHTVGVRANGTAWAWGNGADGKLGTNNTITRSSPVSVVGGFTDWCQVSAGNIHSLGLRSNGTAWAWGNGADGKLGTNNTITRSSPVSVVGGFTDWCQVSAGNIHSLGLRSNGTAWAWGKNEGTTGDGTNISRSSPVSVVGGFTDWCQISAGDCHSLGLRSNGTAWAWGLNEQGRLGSGNVTNRSSPVSVVGAFTDWCQVNAGRQHSLGLRATNFC